MRFLDTSRIRVRLNQRFAENDGTQLSVDLYLPPTPGRYPVLLHRTASDNNRRPRILASRQVVPAAADRWKGYAAQGFIVAAADVRGRGDSDGAFVPFLNEGADGAAAVDWLRSHPECDGKLGALGTGYAAFCAWTAIGAGAPVDETPPGPDQICIAFEPHEIDRMMRPSWWKT
ncbi:MAG TPA: CocE/NonD family hydrolase [Steroidobacteraceae bacterium]|nr:CocE/NonD family hydrolase [Steroidobacteraceae bacterium]